MPMLFSPTIGAAIAGGIVFGCAARPAGPQTRSTFARSIVTLTRLSAA